MHLSFFELKLYYNRVDMTLRVLRPLFSKPSPCFPSCISGPFERHPSISIVRTGLHNTDPSNNIAFLSRLYKEMNCHPNNVHVYWHIFSKMSKWPQEKSWAGKVLLCLVKKTEFCQQRSLSQMFVFSVWVFSCALITLSGDIDGKLRTVIFIDLE